MSVRITCEMFNSNYNNGDWKIVNRAHMYSCTQDRQGSACTLTAFEFESQCA